ncbi:ABC transporter ATP-binding protein [Leptospira levettii]|uniref:ABC transporter ATP-binding protein/permease n=1 Tax=Leptospira levettii TaxID=2023178 RepID=A0AAW5VB96_9LEPT|nr:ABC transporter ATP-binding protein [Leptospira levettii]MCW7466180.1 ABC transporter ATP-binding protein/permease [Leptospira levettii]MCW7512295.1 ABC transporter ATP-binding protein/permease [Leptospira levettii]MCW7516303.1 ABC transporter ATP-binding protein/permease [Leptospira levettii]
MINSFFKQLPEPYKRLWNSISLRRKKQFLLLVLLTLGASFAEIFSIGAIFPFLAVLTNPDKVLEIKELEFVWKFFGIIHSSDIFFFVTIMFILASLLSGAMRLLLIYATTRLSFGTGADISYEIYRRTLFQPYAVHINRNSAEVISGITVKASSVITQIITPILTITSSLIILILILVSLLVVDPMLTLASFGLFSVFYLFVARYYRARLFQNGSILSKQLTIVQKSLQEGLGGIRDIILSNSQRYFLSIYRNSDAAFRLFSAENYYIGASPRYIMESFGMIALALFAYTTGKSSSAINSSLPILGSLAIAAQRVLPILQQSYHGWTNIKAGQENLRNVLDLLEQSVLDENEIFNDKLISFNNQIELKAVNFQYGNKEPWVLNDINVIISKGSRVGIVGRTGNGKSTLMDLLMGLLSPTNGLLLIDGMELNQSNVREWQNLIAHVPQNIYISDSSIAENIAFGIEKSKIDISRVKEAAKKAKIADDIELLPFGYDTYAGERGVKFSGGQRQRIGIARALYRNSSVIFLDEATSALDSETERTIIDSVKELDENVTIFIVAHRLSTLEICNQVYEINDGRLRKQNI